jgi:hypothetical protein
MGWRRHGLDQKPPAMIQLAAHQHVFKGKELQVPMCLTGSAVISTVEKGKKTVFRIGCVAFPLSYTGICRT